MANESQNIEAITADYSKFNHSHRVLQTTGIGRLLPIYSRLLMPGETIRADVNGETYFQPLVTAVKQRFDICYHWFAVPTRIISGGKSEKYYFPDPRKMNNMRSASANKPHIDVTFDKLNVPFFDCVDITPTKLKDHKLAVVPRSYKMGYIYAQMEYKDGFLSWFKNVDDIQSGHYLDLLSDDYKEPIMGKGTLADMFGFPARPAKDYSFEKLPLDFFENNVIVRSDVDWFSKATNRGQAFGKWQSYIESLGYKVSTGSVPEENIYTIMWKKGNDYYLLGIYYLDVETGTYIDVMDNFPFTNGTTTKTLREWISKTELGLTYMFNNLGWNPTSQSYVKNLDLHCGKYAQTEDGIRYGLPAFWYEILRDMQPQDGSNVQQIESWKWRAYMSIVDRFYRDRNYDEELPLDEFFSRNMDEDSNLTASDVFPISGVNTFTAENYDKYTHNILNYPSEVFPKSQTGYSDFLREQFYRYSIRAVEDDVFTSVLPSTIAGDTGTTAPLSFDEQMLSAQNYLTALTADADHPKNAEWLNSDLHIDTNALGLNIEALRNSLRVNQYLKMMHYGGYLPDEQQQMLFNVTNKDYRALRPEYLDGCVTPIVIGDIMNTTLTEYAPLGQLGAIASNRTHSGITYHADEYTVVMCICSIRPKVYYTGGLSKLDTRLTYLDEFKSQFADLGEQEVFSSEINWCPFDLKNSDNSFYCEQSHNNDSVGYQPRYNEYKFTLDRLVGDFKDSMNFWQTSKEFDPYTNVVIDSDFMKIDEHLFDNIFAVLDGTDRIYQQFNFDIAITSPLNMIVSTKLI